MTKRRRVPRKGARPAPVLTPEQQQRELYIAARRREFAMTMAPVFAKEFLTSGGAGEVWSDYPDLADSLWNMADAMARRFA